MNNIKLKIDGFDVLLQYQSSKNEWLAYFIHMQNISACGKSKIDAIKELAATWEMAKENYRGHGETVPTSKDIIK
jgi:predicted RNase H-like HicB family nuclease